MPEALTEAQFFDALKFTVSNVDAAAKNLGLTDDDVVAIISAAALELIAARRGKASAIDHLRNVADVAERELLAGAGARETGE